MTRSLQNTTLHNGMVHALATTYPKFGHVNIKADHIGHPNGAPLNHLGYIPDLTATHASTGQHIICEVETIDTINTQHTFEQLTAFRNAANSMGGILHVGLPYKSDLQTAKNVLANWRIHVDEWWFQFSS